MNKVVESELLSSWVQIQNYVFLVFIFCFLICVHVLGARRKMILAMFYRLFRREERENIFFESVNYEFVSKIMLSIQTSVLLSIFFYCVLIHKSLLEIGSLKSAFIFLGTITIIILLFILFKFILNSLFGIIFFNKEKVRLWNESFFSMFSLNSLVLFIPVLIMFFGRNIYIYCYYFILIDLFFFMLLTIYKIYEIFFLGKRLPLYFILYLCTLEIMPLFLLYKVYSYLFISMQEGTLWLQI